VSGTTVVRVLATIGVAVVTVLVAVYAVNPLRTATRDPRLRVFGVTTFRMPSRAMQPTLQLNEVFVVSAWPYRNSDPRPGDIVVFQYPLDPSTVFVKRVIAAGPSTVEIVDGVPSVDGRAVEEPYVDPRNNTKPYSRTLARVQIPADAFFVMGDNRDDSDDSRAWGFVPRSRILGKVK
jgi:signal peptidase I